MHGLSDRLMHWQLICLVQVDLGQKYHAPQVQPGRGLNSWPPDHDSTFHVKAFDELKINLIRALSRQFYFGPHKWFQIMSSCIKLFICTSIHTLFSSGSWRRNASINYSQNRTIGRSFMVIIHSQFHKIHNFLSDLDYGEETERHAQAKISSNFVIASTE